MSISVSNSWPDSLPLPLDEYGGEPINASLASAQSSLLIDRRSTREKEYDRLVIRWIFDVPQFDRFRNFWDMDLKNGVSKFQILLLFPENSGLVDWIVKFSSAGYQSAWLDGAWSVEAEIELHSKVNI